MMSFEVEEKADWLERHVGGKRGKTDGGGGWREEWRVVPNQGAERRSRVGVRVGGR